MTSTVLNAFAAEQHPANAHFYLLLDPLAKCASDDPLHLDILRGLVGDAAITIVPRPDLAHTPDACPVLVTLAEPGQRPCATILNHCLDHARRELGQQKRYVCGTLSSAADADTLAARIISLGYLLYAAGEKRYVPVHEPLRLELLTAMKTRVARDPLASIEHWLFPGSHGEFIALSDVGGRVLDEEAGSAQQDVPLISALLNTWRTTLLIPHLEHRWGRASPLSPQSSLSAYTHIQQARQLGLTRAEDIQTLVVYQLILHGRVHEHKYIRPAIAEAIAGGVPLDVQFSSHEDAFWRRILASLTQAGMPQ